MSNKKSSIQWVVGKLGDLESMFNLGIIDNIQYYEEKTKLLEQAKAMHKEEHSNTWDYSVYNYLERGKNVVRHWSDFDEYYNDKYK